MHKNTGLCVALSTAALLAGLAGCDDNLSAPTSSQIDLAALCVSSACGSKTKLVTIPSAENAYFTPEGRLFVSGSQNVYEITHDASGWHAAPIFAGTAEFTGMAQRGDVLYVNGIANGTDAELYAAQLSAKPKLAPIHPLGVPIPNGMTAGPDGALYFVNGPEVPVGVKIVRLRFDASDPMKVVEQSDWLTHDLQFPNGITSRGRTLIFTDSNAVPPQFGLLKAVDIQADGSPGPVRTLTTFSSIPDDPAIAGAGELVALYSGGFIALVGADGSVLQQTDPNSFDSPSSAVLGQPPMFAPKDIVATEKGILGVDTGPYGNALSVFRRKP